MKRLGVLGTMVWDTIYGRGDSDEAVEEWGGISYALSSLEATLPDDWEIVPIVKVGRDLAPRANDFLRNLTRRSASVRFIEVPEPNNRVTLRYLDEQRRSERLRGGVPPWTWNELGPMLDDVDVLYVNLISGFEISLETARLIRHGYGGPIYCDLHSLLLGTSHEGLREPRPLAEINEWFSCFDVIQMNEQELGLVGDDPMRVAATAFSAGVRLLVVTLGPRGTAYFTVRPFDFFDRTPRSGPIETARIDAEQLEEGDPTGCGDVLGASLISQLIRGTGLEQSIRFANRLAGRNLQCRGATNLHYFLKGEIAPR